MTRLATPPPPSREGLLARIGRFSFRHHWPVIGAWIVLVVVLSGISGALGPTFRSQFSSIGSESDHGIKVLTKGFGKSAGGQQGQIAFKSASGINDPAVVTAMKGLFAKVRKVGRVALVTPYDGPTTARQIAATGPYATKLAYATVEFPNGLSQDQVQKRAKAIKRLTPAGLSRDQLQVDYGGEMFADFKPPSSELLGLAFAIVILIMAFGSVLAMGLPIGMAVAGIGAGIGTIGILTHVMPMPDFATTLAAMIGLGVGIDYALFIITRYREHLHAGESPEESVVAALDTAGRAVMFAGITVIISLMGLLLMGLAFVRGLAVGSTSAVLFVLLASVTLLPAMLGLAQHRIELTRWRGLIGAGLVAVAFFGIGLKVKAFALLLVLAVVIVALGSFVPALKKPLPPRKVTPLRETGWYKWSRGIQHHPWRAAGAGLAVLVVLALPVFSLRLGFSDTGNGKTDQTSRRAYDLLASGFGPGFNGPILVAAEIPEGKLEALGAITAALQKTPGVAAATPFQPNPAGTVAQAVVFATTSPQDAATTKLVNTLRREVIPAAVAGTGLRVSLTGGQAINIDFSHYLARRMPIFFGAVLLLSFLLLMAVFRSLLVPLKAVIMNLLSIGAAYGIVVAVFEWGWLKGLVGIGKGGPIEPFIPMMLFAIVFGLSMDYEVFLLSRMKEEFDRTGDNATSVADGLAVTARVITAAAGIMVFVFGSFLLEGNRIIKLFGLGLSVAVLLDATVVRMLLVPATMELLGARNWWFPKWLDRLLPKVDVEGSHHVIADAVAVPESVPARESVSVDG